MVAKNSHKPWTRKEVAQLRKEAKGNTPTRILGLKHKRTPVAIQTKAQEIGLSLEPHNRSPYGTKKR
jgi:hypothetical protein